MTTSPSDDCEVCACCGLDLRIGQSNFCSARCEAAQGENIREYLNACAEDRYPFERPRRPADILGLAAAISRADVARLVSGRYVPPLIDAQPYNDPQDKENLYGPDGFTKSE